MGVQKCQNPAAIACTDSRQTQFVVFHANNQPLYHFRADMPAL